MAKSTLWLWGVLLWGCQPAPVPNGAAPSALPVPSLTPAAPVSSPTVAPSVTPSAAPSVLTPPLLPAGLATLQIQTGTRFLNGKGQSLRLEVVGFDAQGQRVNGPLPLSFVLSRPEDFSVSPDGTVTALKEFGFSEVIIRVVGTALEARTLLSVADFSSGFSGGGAASNAAVNGPINVPPIITSVATTASTVNGSGWPIRLDAVGSDPEGAPLSYVWSCLDSGCDGFIPSTTGATVYWRSPAASGTYRLQLRLSDGQNTVVQTLPIVVNAGIGAIDVQVGPEPVVTDPPT